MIRESAGRKLFRVTNFSLLVLLALMCLLPVVHILALSLSSAVSVQAGLVTLWPVNFTTRSYDIVMKRADFLASFGVSLRRVGLGLIINMLLVVITAYPLSKDNREFHMRTAYAWYMIVTIIFSGGLIPTYMVVKQLGLINNLWALILPGAVPVWNIVLMMNFFRSLPKSIEESAFIDGAGHGTVLFKLHIPLSLPAIATISLFTIVGHWNSWFDGLIYLNKPEMYPLQTFLRMIDVASQLKNMSTANVEFLRDISDKTVRSAQIFIAMVPVLCVYPFLQKYFVKGIVMGSVKG
ncbi:MAG: carbohydrate ABC transporter permease [Clostridiales bacterium]|nr:carbohydrate ABC transporter permease [Clostridiales bacterium]